MTYACADCSGCGKCYNKKSVCPNCGNDINLLDDACQVCGETITDAMRDEARSAYIERKKQDRAHVFELAQAAKKKRAEQEQSRPAYPWEK